MIGSSSKREDCTGAYMEKEKENYSSGLPKADTKTSLDEYRDWILRHTPDWCAVTEKQKDDVRLDSQFGEMEIRFYDGDIVEISIIRKKDSQLRYYLHFELKKEEHAKDMFNDMLDALYSLRRETTLRVLLSCTSGATTSYLAGKLNQLAEESGLDWSFSAVPYLQLIENADKADLILIAPQIGYLKKKIEGALPEKMISQIPTSLFSAFDASGTIDYIRQLLQSQKEEERISQKQLSLSEKDEKRLPTRASVLAVCIIMDNEQLYVTLRYYEKGERKEEAKAVFVHMKRKYLWQEISYMLRGRRKPDWIVFAVPGVVSDESLVSMKKMNMDHFNLAAEVERRYQARCLVVNNVDACALGCSHLQPDYDSLALISLPYGATGTGIGSVIHGRMLAGRRGLAGESKFYLNRMQFSNTLEKLCRTEEGHYEMLTATILPLISIIDPDVIYLRTPLVPDVKELAARLSNFISEEYIPKLVYIENPLDEIFLGMALLIAGKDKKEERSGS